MDLSSDHRKSKKIKMAKNTAHSLTEFLKHAKNFWTANKDT